MTNVVCCSSVRLWYTSMFTANKEDKDGNSYLTCKKGLKQSLRDKMFNYFDYVTVLKGTIQRCYC